MWVAFEPQTSEGSSRPYSYGTDPNLPDLPKSWGGAPSGVFHSSWFLIICLGQGGNISTASSYAGQKDEPLRWDRRLDPSCWVRNRDPSWWHSRFLRSCCCLFLCWISGHPICFCPKLVLICSSTAQLCRSGGSPIKAASRTRRRASPRQRKMETVASCSGRAAELKRWQTTAL
ncbi:hypothetical protein ASPVEDRAFT_510352 [Aspergillus versicolor CBS 583.65]|uniref:Uncharacterized protein n=1 Tax=Aspergillus versicolor CBS 583.65 TaxID=1036611 RepID=A0A1L9PD18_ASPVE|nr:uncharacterized protein ASPVEDRAFT_510352 [Aspergillus versicolor CBS 583.65]OJI99372.1 hypothetical protein ASPVEDRAFT_510352 [Aspergillus versicolor CBS 583.65]